MLIKNVIQQYVLPSFLLCTAGMSTTGIASALSLQNLPVKNIKINNQTPYNIPFSVYVWVNSPGILPYQSSIKTINANTQEWFFTKDMPYVPLKDVTKTSTAIEITNSDTHQFIGTFTLDNQQATGCTGYLTLFLQTDGTLGYTYLVACP